jgi:DNA-binding GntR family transcriptional regulator
MAWAIRAPYLATHRIADDELGRLEKLVANICELNQPQAVESRRVYHQFHAGIYIGAGSPRLHNVVGHYLELAEEHQRVALAVGWNASGSVFEYEGIISSLWRRGRERRRQLMGALLDTTTTEPDRVLTAPRNAL